MQSASIRHSYLDLVGTLYKFAVVGVLSNAAGFALYCLVTWLSMPPLFAMTILYGIGVLIGYIGNFNWTFRSNRKSPQQVTKYIAAQLGGYGIDFVLLFWFAQRMGYPHQIVQAAAVVIVAIYLFVALRFFVFPETKDA